MQPQGQTTPIFSSLKGDPDMDDLVTIFVHEMSETVTTMQSSYEQRDWEQLRNVAHQLKGASGGYGFEEMGQAASTLEKLLKSGDDDLDAIALELSALTDLCLRASA